MSKTVQNTETKRITYRIEERCADRVVAHAWNLDGADGTEAWLWFTRYRETYPWRYTPRGARRLVLLAVGGGK